jgi:hypothetical protein
MYKCNDDFIDSSINIGNERVPEESRAGRKCGMPYYVL